MTKRTFYDELQVSQNADPETIKAAYKSLVQRYHPDKNPDSLNAENQLKDINRAYEVLSDPVKRARYDAGLTEDDEDLTANRNDTSDSSSMSAAAENDANLRSRALAFFDIIPGAASIQFSTWLFHGSPLALGLSIAIGGGLAISLCHSIRTRLIKNVRTRSASIFLSLSISLGISLALLTTAAFLRTKDGERAALSSGQFDPTLHKPQDQFDPSTAVLEPTPQDLRPAAVANAVKQSSEVPVLVAPVATDSTVQYNIGLKYKNGLDVPQDDAQAAQWFRLAAQQGHATAQSNLGVMFGNGEGVPQDYAQAMMWFRKAADQGYAKAQFNLGVMYRDGQGVRRDYTQAAQWFLNAADQGLATAQFNLGEMYRTGLGVPQDSVQAIKWFRKAADQGIAVAQAQVGVQYALGIGVTQDDAQAAQWFSKAANQGDANSQFIVGTRYFEGLGVPQDYTQAIMWFLIAKASGDTKIDRIWQKIEAVVTSEQIAEGQRMAREWWSAHHPEN